MKKFLAITLVVLLALSFVACGNKEKEADLQTYDSGEGLTVSMPIGFGEENSDDLGLTYFITSENSAFTALKETNEELASAGIDTENLTLKGYSEFVISANDLDDEFTEDANGNLCISYTKDIDGTEYSYYTVLKEGTDCYWICNFFCLADDEEIFAKFSEWASTITVE